MSSVVFFKDSSKRYSDLLTKDFGADENKFKFTGKSGDVTFEATLLNKGESSTGTFAPKYEYKAWKATFSGEVNTKKESKVEVSFKDPFPGLKATVTAQLGDKSSVGTGAIEYKKDLAAVTASADFGNTDGSNLKASANLQVWKSLSVGGSVHYLHGEKSVVKEIKAAATWNTDEYDVGAFGAVTNKNGAEKTEIGVNYFHKINSDLVVGTEVALDPNSSDKKDTRMVFGTQYRVDDSTTVKAKVDVTGKVGLSYIQKFTKSSSFTLSASIDTNHFSNQNTSRFGVSVNLE